MKSFVEVAMELIMQERDV